MSFDASIELIGACNQSKESTCTTTNGTCTTCTTITTITTCTTCTTYPYLISTDQPPLALVLHGGGDVVALGRVAAQGIAVVVDRCHQHNVETGRVVELCDLSTDTDLGR